MGTHDDYKRCMCRHFPTDPNNVGADCPVEGEVIDINNPLEEYQEQAPEGMAQSEPRYDTVDKKKVADEGLDYDSIENNVCKNRAKNFDRFCHDFKGKGLVQFRDYRNE